MPRKMSFMLTTPQIKNRTKTVTRRLGWWNLKPDQIVDACEKCMGLKKGEKVIILDKIIIINTRPEPLNRIIGNQHEVIREGFPEMDPHKFISMFCMHNGCEPWTVINRIEFEYVD